MFVKYVTVLFAVKSTEIIMSEDAVIPFLYRKAFFLEGERSI